MEISGRTRLLGLIGSPVEHSASPAMYIYCFEKYDLDCELCHWAGKYVIGVEPMPYSGTLKV